MTRQNENAIYEMYRAVQKQKNKVTILITGPATNVALLLTVFPDVKEKIEKIVIMGGGIGMGNMTPVAEFNAFCDPDALQIVVDAGTQVAIIPYISLSIVLSAHSIECY
jgi:inosine-uridine nucleoside N-ribohydrolase